MLESQRLRRPSFRVFYRLWKQRAHHRKRLIARSYRWPATIRANRLDAWTCHFARSTVISSDIAG